MNILIVPSWYTSSGNPLNGIFFKEQAAALKRYSQNHNADDKIVVLALERIPITGLKKHIRNFRAVVTLEDDIPTVRASFLGIPGLKRIDLWIGAKKLGSCINKAQKKFGMRFDLAHIHSALNAGIWYSLSKQKIPYVITEHSNAYSRKLISESQKRYLPKVFDNSARIIAVGNGLAHEIGKYTGKPVEVIFNIVSPIFNSFDKAQRTDDAFTFFSLGLNARKKGFDILLSAFSSYILGGNKGKLVIAGLEDTEREWLLSFGFDPEVLLNVALLGKMDRQAVLSRMATCDCFIVVSRHETFGVVFAEAMYCGKPVIATRTGGPDSFVNDENGILVDAEDVEQTASALVRMAGDIGKYNPDKIRKYATDNFSEDVICGKLHGIYNSVLRGNRE